MALVTPWAPSTGGYAERAQHDGGMAVGTAFFGDNPGETGRTEQRGIRRTQVVHDEHRPLRQLGKALEGRLGQVADQASADLANLVGPALEPGAIAVLHGRHGGGQGLGLLQHGRLRGGEPFDPPPRPAQEAGRADHLEIGIDERLKLGLALSWEHGELGAQLAELPARLGDRVIQPGQLGFHRIGRDGTMHENRRLVLDEIGGAYGDAGTDGQAGKAAFCRRACVRRRECRR